MKHFLIIGGGLAGSTLAYQLLNQNCKVDVVDAGYNHSSKVAAGQVNPMVFRRMNKSWRVDELLAYAPHFYHQIEAQSKQTFFSDQTIRRLFAHEQERQLWLERQENAAYQPYLATIEQADKSYNGAINTFGSGRVKQGFCIHAPTFLSAIHQLLQEHENGSFFTEQIDWEDIQTEDRTWKQKQFDGIIYCLGYENSQAKIWADFTINTTKGQVLTITSESLPTDESLNRKCFLIPQPNGQFRAGSTFEWHQPNAETTAAGRDLIEKNLRSLIREPYEVVDHVAGVRPTTKDRRPICGEHPAAPGHFIFNGLGSKGYMLAPLLSSEMADYILKKTPLNEEVNLQRFLDK